MGLYTSVSLETNQMNGEAVHGFVSRPMRYITPYTATEQDLIPNSTLLKNM